MNRNVIIAVVALGAAVAGYIIYTNKKKKADETVALTTPAGTVAVTPSSGTVATTPIATPTEKEFSLFDYTTWGW